jgi:hypothetical protein
VPAPVQEQQQGSDVIEWRPDASTAITWNVVGVTLTVAGLFLFALPSILRSGSASGSASGSVTLSLLDLLVVVALTAVLLAAHEGIHGLLMLGFGARPTFGALLVAHLVPALYATAPGHCFTRGEYLVIAAAPAVVISGLGFLACFGPWAGYLVVPLAIHLGGCVGDGFAALRTRREPPTTLCEDLRDGIRFHRLPGAERAATP